MMRAAYDGDQRLEEHRPTVRRDFPEKRRCWLTRPKGRAAFGSPRSHGSSPPSGSSAFVWWMSSHPAPQYHRRQSWRRTLPLTTRPAVHALLKLNPKLRGSIPANGTGFGVHRAGPNKNTHDPRGSGPKTAWCVGYDQKVTNMKSTVHGHYQ